VGVKVKVMVGIITNEVFAPLISICSFFVCKNKIILNTVTPKNNNKNICLFRMAQ
jgi:hypothetical protein